MTDVIEANEPAVRRGRPPKQEEPKLYPVKLLKNSAPRDHASGAEVPFEIVGHWTPERVINSPDGTGKKTIPSEFVAGEEAPPPYPGVGTQDRKIWAGTIVKFPRDHGRFLIEKGIAQRADNFGED